MKRELETAVAAVVKDLLTADVAVELTRPDEKFGDYATNVALQLAQKTGQNPRQVAEALAQKLRQVLADKISDISVAGPGFINLKLNDKALIASLDVKPAQALAGKQIVAEYSDPNPFKVLHAGHVYTTVVGDAIANLLEAAGGQVHRVNYGGDVGLHVGKTMWAILQKIDGDHPEKLQTIAPDQRASWLAQAYVEGNDAYENNEQVKAEIVELNKRVYQLFENNDHDSDFAKIYWTCRQWSYEAFDAFYEQLGTHLEKYYPESEVAGLGLRLVNEQLGTVFEKSDGAVIFNGEKYGLHTRVFINQQGLPTYEAKEVGLIVKKQEDYHFNRSIVVTGNEQQEYMAVVLKAIEQFLPELAAATTYVPHGMVRLAGGVKMSSRKGNIIPATEVLNITSEAIKASGRESNSMTMLGAVKYAFLKNRIGSDVIYDPKESVSLEGNSGPYLQYAYARAQSILGKATQVDGILKPVQDDVELEVDERGLVRKIGEYPEVVDQAVKELMPHHVCTYLYELAQTFNRFYENNRVIGDARQGVRLTLVKQYAETLKSGLQLLGISAPDKM